MPRRLVTSPAIERLHGRMRAARLRSAGPRVTVCRPHDDILKGRCDRRA